MRLIDADELKPDLLIDGKPMYGIVLSLETIEFIIDEQPTVNEWVSVSERLPDTYTIKGETLGFLNGQICRQNDIEISDYVLVICDSVAEYGIPVVARYGPKIGWQFQGLSKFAHDRVIAWMPIPEYRGNDNED